MELLAFFGKIFTSSWVVFLLLLVYARIFSPEKLKSFAKEMKLYAVFLLLLLTGTVVWFTFFEDAEFRFVCRKETQRCEYYHSTLFNKELRIAGSFGLDGIDNVEIKRHTRYAGRRRARRPCYAVSFSGNGKSFEMPKKFNYQSDAQKQASLAGAFLHTDVPEYVYTESTDSAEGMIVFSMFILYGTTIMACFSLLSKLFEKQDNAGIKQQKKR